MSGAVLALPVRADDRLDVERIAAQIAECKNLDELRDIRGAAKAIEAYQRASNAALQVQNDAIEIRLRADRQVGVLLRDGLPHGGDRKSKSRHATLKLADLDITKSQSSRSQKLAEVPQGVFERHLDNTKARGEKLTTAGTIAAVSHSPEHDSDEWYTPPDVIAAARQVLGGIDLDPASNDIAQKTVKASRYFTKEDDGLSQEWGGHVWLNPPFSASLASAFVRKLIDEIDAGRVTEAVLLQNCTCTCTSWFHELAPRCALCFPRGRLKFYRAEGKAAGSSYYGQVILYFGPDVDLFAETFGAFGLVVTPERRAA